MGGCVRIRDNSHRNASSGASSSHRRHSFIYSFAHFPKGIERNGHFQMANQNQEARKWIA